jgi:uncharacterized protein YciI
MVDPAPAESTRRCYSDLQSFELGPQADARAAILPAITDGGSAMATMLSSAAMRFCLLLGAALTSPSALWAAGPSYDAELARSTGADERGMKSYVLVVLKTGPTRVPAGPEREEMFKGHFANIERLAAEGKLVLAGPFDGVDGWRGMFVLAVPDVEAARQHVATDPVIMKGEMVAEYHKYYGSAALMLINDLHKRLVPTRKISADPS